MNTKLEKYLDTVDKYLRPLPVSERVDIVKEIKSSILEMENAGVSAEQIEERLGNPKELAKAYLGDLLANSSGLGWKRILTICAFYSVAGFSGLFVIPTLGIMAPVLLITGIITPIFGLVKLVGAILGYDMPYIVFQLGPVTLSPALAFVASLIMGALLIVAGWFLWKLLLAYIKKVSTTKTKLSI